MLKKMKVTIKKFLFLFIVFTILQSCKVLNNNGLENGDLLFVTAQQENLSGAINRVTQIKETENYDHIGIVEKTKTSIFVLHAAPKGGSQKELLTDFMNHQTKGNSGIYVYRLKKDYQNAVPKALEKANLLLGKPYNFTYVLNDETLYCSDFIERIFRENQIFELKPMTFINPKTGKTDDFWLNFYQQKNMEVPEGRLGCNPNGLAGSDKLMKIKKLK
jgi:uncharacterized protein YycO